MPIENLSRKLAAVLVALAMLIATAPFVGASASAGSAPCDCPSMHAMQMDMHHMAPQSSPAKDHGSPCKDAQKCICCVACAAAISLPQILSAANSNLLRQRTALPAFDRGHGISIRPALPPPIASV